MRTYHNRLGHRRLESIAEVQHPLLIVSEQNVFLTALQERGLGHSRLAQTERRDRGGEVNCHTLVLIFIYALLTFPLSSILFRNFWLALYLICSISSSLLKIQYFLCELLWNMAACERKRGAKLCDRGRINTNSDRK